jgi:hypothetical protein
MERHTVAAWGHGETMLETINGGEPNEQAKRSLAQARHVAVELITLECRTAQACVRMSPWMELSWKVVLVANQCQGIGEYQSLVDQPTD